MILRAFLGLSSLPQSQKLAKTVVNGFLSRKLASNVGIENYEAASADLFDPFTARVILLLRLQPFLKT